MSNKEKIVVLFDDMGDRWEVYDIISMRAELLDDDLEMLYKSSRYYHEFELYKIELIESGLMAQVEGEEYQSELTLNGILHLGQEITNRLGYEVLKEYDDEVDSSWQENKPDLSKYNKKS